MTKSNNAECRLITPEGRNNNTYSGKQGFDYFEGIAKQTVNSSAICMHLLEIPPGGRAKAHKHDTTRNGNLCAGGRGTHVVG